MDRQLQSASYSANASNCPGAGPQLDPGVGNCVSILRQVIGAELIGHHSLPAESDISSQRVWKQSQDLNPLTALWNAEPRSFKHEAKTKTVG